MLLIWFNLVWYAKSCGLVLVWVLKTFLFGSTPFLEHVVNKFSHLYHIISICQVWKYDFLLLSAEIVRMFFCSGAHLRSRLLRHMFVISLLGMLELKPNVRDPIYSLIFSGQKNQYFTVNSKTLVTTTLIPVCMGSYLMNLNLIYMFMLVGSFPHLAVHWGNDY